MNEDELLAELERVGAVDDDGVEKELESVGARDEPGVVDRVVGAIADSPVTKSFAKGLGSREAEREPSAFNTGNRIIDTAARHAPPAQALNYLERVSRNPGSVLEDLGRVVEGGIDLQTGKVARDLGVAVRSGKGGEVLQALAESLGRDVAHGGLDPERPVQSPVNVLGIGSAGAGALQRMPGFQPPTREAGAGVVRRALHKRGRYFDAQDKAGKAKNYLVTGPQKKANDIMRQIVEQDTKILGALDDSPRNAAIRKAVGERRALADSLARAVLGEGDDAGLSIDDIQQALASKSDEVDSLMQLRRSESGASAMGSAKGHQRTFDYKPAVNEVKAAQMDLREARGARDVALDVANRDPLSSIIVPERGGNSAFLQTAINKFKDAVLGGSAEGAFARERLLRELQPRSPGTAAPAVATSSDEALRKLYEALSPWDLAD